MSYTPEPWKTYNDGTDICDDMRHVAGCETKADAIRITACVNACAGISTENLEENLPVKELARRYNETIKQRDELLNALELAAETISALETEGDLDTETMPVIMGAIDSVKGVS